MSGKPIPPDPDLSLRDLERDEWSECWRRYEDRLRWTNFGSYVRAEQGER